MWPVSFLLTTPKDCRKLDLTYWFYVNSNQAQLFFSPIRPKKSSYPESGWRKSSQDNLWFQMIDKLKFHLSIGKLFLHIFILHWKKSLKQKFFRMSRWSGVVTVKLESRKNAEQPRLTQERISLILHNIKLRSRIQILFISEVSFNRTSWNLFVKL